MTESEEIITYQIARQFLYPSLGDQIDAAYWARNGNTSLQEAIDAKIVEVKTLVPKTWASRSSAEFGTWLESNGL